MSTQEKSLAQIQLMTSALLLTQQVSQLSLRCCMPPNATNKVTMHPAYAMKLLNMQRFPVHVLQIFVPNLTEINGY